MRADKADATLFGRTSEEKKVIFRVSQVENWTDHSYTLKFSESVFLVQKRFSCSL